MKQHYLITTSQAGDEAIASSARKAAEYAIDAVIDATELGHTKVDFHRRRLASLIRDHGQAETSTAQLRGLASCTGSVTVTVKALPAV